MNKDLVTANFEIVNENLPALFQVADAASAKGQNNYLRLVIANLISLALGAISTSYTFSSEGFQTVTAGVGAISFFVGLLLTLAIYVGSSDKLWYGARAVAESVKTISWRYMICAEPFEISRPQSGTDTLFSEALSKILADRKHLAFAFGGSLGASDQISNKMRQLRNAELAIRKEVYIRCRIQSQREWYSCKAEENEKKRHIWFWILAFAQVLAFIAVLYLTKSPGSKFNFVGFFSTVGAALISWIQVKRFQELSQSYAVTAHELGLIKEQVQHISNEGEFSHFVSDAESAISREHTLWVARRDS